jgi:ATP-dependent DNA helicase RecG
MAARRPSNFGSASTRSKDVEMDWLEVLRRVRAGEDSRTEFGRYRSSADKDWLKSLCAMANSEGGLIVLGVLDDGTIDGVPMDPEKVSELLTNQLQNGLGVPVPARLGRHEDPSGWVHWIEVSRVRFPEPLRYRGRVYVRRGRATVEPSGSELQELFNSFGFILTEEQLLPGASVSDIDPEVFYDYLRDKGIEPDSGPRIPLERDLENWEVVREDHDGELRPTVFGIMCFGRSPQAAPETRGFFVDLVAYGGVDRADPVISSAKARGRVDEQVERALDWVGSLGREERYRGQLREKDQILPTIALREALVNAVAHRDYSVLGERVLVEVFDDRVHVRSPGGLPNHKTASSVLSGGGPRSRNEAIANFLLDRRLMEQRGTGFPRMRRAMQDFNGTEPDLEHDPVERWVRITFRRTGGAEEVDADQ